MADNTTEHSLYDGDVKLVFNPDSPRYRYTVTDEVVGIRDLSIRGVTSILRDIIAKPDLMTWPMNMSNQYLFGTKFDEALKGYTHNWANAALKPAMAYTEEELHEMFLEGSRQWTRRSDKGKDVGTMTHSAIEHYLKGELMEWPVLEATDKEGLENVKMAKKALGAFTSWWEQLEDKEVLGLEKVVYSRGMKYAGTFDLLARINGKTYMLDIKTTNASKKAPMGIYAEYFLQLGAYSYAEKEESGVHVDDVGIIRVGKDGKLHIATAKDIGFDVDQCERMFAFAVRLHDLLERATPFISDAHFKSHLIPSDAGRAEDSVS